jgi:hypothetical protein
MPILACIIASTPIRNRQGGKGFPFARSRLWDIPCDPGGHSCQRLSAVTTFQKAGTSPPAYAGCSPRSHSRREGVGGYLVKATWRRGRACARATTTARASGGAARGVVAAAVGHLAPPLERHADRLGTARPGGPGRAGGDVNADSSDVHGAVTGGDEGAKGATADALHLCLVGPEQPPGLGRSMHRSLLLVVRKQPALADSPRGPACGSGCSSRT